MVLVGALCAAFLAAGDDPAPKVDAKVLEQALREFKEAYKAPDATDRSRVAAVRKLAKVRHRKTKVVLAALIFKDAVPVAYAAAEALGNFEGVTGVTPLLLSALRANRKRPEVQRGVIGALGKLRAREALSVLHDLAGQPPFDVARDAIIAIGKIRHRQSVAPLIALLRIVETSKGTGVADVEGLPGIGDRASVLPDDPRFRNLPGGTGVLNEETRREYEERLRLLQRPLNEALSSITKEKFGTYKEWSGWWRKNAATFKVRK